MKDNIITGIYCIENMRNGKKYIGQSKNIKDRWRRHKSSLRNLKHDNSYLQESWIVYGESAFNFYVLEECAIDDLDERERYYIDVFETMSYERGYNLTSGGNSGSALSEVSRQKLSKSITASYTEELKEIRRQDTLKYWSNPENKKRILGENNVMYGKHHSEESKRKMSEVKKSKHTISWRRNLTPVFCKELKREFQDATAAGKELGIDGCAILKVCQGKRYTCGGYHWEFC